MKNFSFTFILFFITLGSAFSHEGRAYLVFQNKKVGTDQLSVRVDPDKGEGTFEFFVEGQPASAYEIGIKASPAADPAHVLSAAAVIEKGESRPERLVYKAVVPFDQAVAWNVETVLKQKNNIVFTSKDLVEVLEPGPNKKEFALYFMPFLLVGFLAFKVVLAKRKTALKSPKSPSGIN